ncbi:MAG: hypothetical protein JOY86_01850 [Candidatus Eremiobacteraeota bacterium]|nr:hypothetical protein [Candidatus Eremiobacteraeota bacterium]
MRVAPAYPRLGPLFGAAFDRAIAITLRSWPWIIAITIIDVAVAWFQLSDRIADLSDAVWSFFAAANAARTVDPNYRMTGATVGRLIVVGLATALGAGVGAIALIWPGLYLATKLSMAPAAVVFDGLGAEGGIGQSWGLTTGRFWQTFLFGVLTQIAIVLPFFVGVLIVGGLSSLLISLGVLHVEWDRAYAIGVQIITPILLYGTQAGWLAGLYWYQGLKAMRDAEFAVA